MVKYQKAVALDPYYVDTYNDLGIIYEARGQTERARQMYLKAIEINPNYPNSYSNLALLYESQRDYTNAILCWLKRAMLGTPGDPWAEAARRRLEDIARVYPEAYSQIRQSPTSKITLFKEEASFDIPEQQDTKSRALQYLGRAQENYSKGQYVTALKEAITAEYLDPSNPQISDFVERVRKALLQ